MFKDSMDMIFNITKDDAKAKYGIRNESYMEHLCNIRIKYVVFLFVINHSNKSQWTIEIETK